LFILILGQTAGGTQIVDFEFCPFSKNVVATSSRDALVKIWAHPTWDLVHDMEIAEYYLAGHEKKVDIIKFNPAVSNLILTCSRCSLFFPC